MDMSTPPTIPNVSKLCATGKNEFIRYSTLVITWIHTNMHSTCKLFLWGHTPRERGVAEGTNSMLLAFLCVHSKFRIKNFCFGGTFSLTHNQEEIWLGNPKVLGLKSILDVRLFTLMSKHGNFILDLVLVVLVMNFL